MFIALTTYGSGGDLPRLVVEQHWRYLDSQYDIGRLVCSGPQASGSGGAMVLAVRDEVQARLLMESDPLVAQGLVTYQLIEFKATRAANPEWVEQ